MEENKRRIEVMVCEYCGKEFIPKTKTQKFCSNLNYSKCAFCGGSFEHKCKKPKKYCSRACNYKDAGRRASDEMFKKYGVRSSLSLKSVKQKAQRTMKEKYGANNYFATDKFKEQQKSIFLKKYNGHPMKIQKFKNKQKETCEFKYGVSNISKLLETKQKVITTCKSKYGVTNISKVKEFIESRVKNTDFKRLQEKRRKTLLKKTGYSENFSDPKCRLLIAKTNMRRYNTPFPVVFGKQAISKINRSFSESLLRANLPHKMEYRLNNFIYDFLVEDGKILVDINPTVSHNSTISYACLLHKCEGACSHQKIPFDYHQKRLENALENGYSYIQVWDWMNKDEVLDNIKNKNLLPKSICNIGDVTVIDTSIISIEYYKTIQSHIIKKEPYTVYLMTEKKSFLLQMSFIYL